MFPFEHAPRLELVRSELVDAACIQLACDTWNWRKNTLTCRWMHTWRDILRRDPMRKLQHNGVLTRTQQRPNVSLELHVLWVCLQHLLCFHVPGVVVKLPNVPASVERSFLLLVIARINGMQRRNAVKNEDVFGLFQRHVSTNFSCKRGKQTCAKALVFMHPGVMLLGKVQILLHAVWLNVVALQLMDKLAP